ncbi:MAG: diguanylate cyclase [Deltaproteobacteria bacterium]|nr:diguanylate cyclase [Deltaproteobacteria bacterium]MBW2048217.1 diguanylate cyclase [Deltaproteobacteria bacterium]MBW2111449.1 diguanylate cyclase [Deltaproteobacteria bacterium]
MEVKGFPVLVVEDDTVSRKLLEITLRKAGYRVTSVKNGLEALDIFKSSFFPIVLTDWMMPEMDGVQLCRAIREEVSTGYVFIFMLTARGSTDDLVEGLEAGADDYLTKPFNRAELIARLKTATRILELERSLKEANEEIRILSITDSLTGSYNRTYMNQNLPKEVRRATRYNRPISLVMVDIDHFKRVNDTYGHQAGDQVLKGLVETITASVRSGIDWVARYGGEEFLVVFPETEFQKAMGLAERLRRDVSDMKIQIKGGTIQVTASFGVSGFSPSTSPKEISHEAVINLADQALYQAKREGRNRVVGHPAGP